MKPKPRLALAIGMFEHLAAFDQRWAHGKWLEAFEAPLAERAALQEAAARAYDDARGSYDTLVYALAYGERGYLQ